MVLKKGTLSYKAFVVFSFQILIAIYKLHTLSVWHRDIKAANVLVCTSEISERYIRYVVGENIWTINYEDTGNRDLKIIDYGESVIEEKVKNPCLEFLYEVTVATSNIIQLMWSKTLNKTNEQVSPLI